MSVLVLLGCIVWLAVRLRRRGTVLVPALLGGVALYVTVASVLALEQVFASLQGMPQSDQAAVLAAVISELLKTQLRWFVPMVIAAIVFDRWWVKKKAVPQAG